jgi:GT2 family glycosyltransferase
MPKILIQCVVVLYQCTPENSSALKFFGQFCHQQNKLSHRAALLVYDNSPLPQTNMSINQWDCGAFEYRHDARNGGLASAYNEALAIAKQRGTEWLLLLDQDATPSVDFISTLYATIESPLPEKVCAIVPKLVQHGQILSPQRVGRYRNHHILLTTFGLQREPVTAFNSAACLRVSFANSVGGFPLFYWLDFLDHIMFYRLQRAGGRVFILDAVMEHRLSLENLEMEMSLDRYANLLAAEWMFIRDTRWGGGPVFHRLRLLRRTFRYAIRLHNKTYALRTLHAIWGEGQSSD